MLSCPTRKAEDLCPRLFKRVAGPGIEPGSGGYEPPEVPLLYPAMYFRIVSPHPYRICTGCMIFFKISTTSCYSSPNCLTPLCTLELFLLILTGSIHLLAILLRKAHNLAQKVLRQFPELSHPAIYTARTLLISTLYDDLTKQDFCPTRYLRMYLIFCGNAN